jgi:hypothetical protein
VDSGGKSSDSTNDGSLGELLTTKNISSDSIHNSSRSSNSAPRYHYYGLASTQSQAQSHDDLPDNEHSQKENFDSSGSSGENRTGVASSVGPRPAASHASSSSKVPNKESMPHGVQSSHQAIGIKVGFAQRIPYFLSSDFDSISSPKQPRQRQQRSRPPEPLPRTI